MPLANTYLAQHLLPRPEPRLPQNAPAPMVALHPVTKREVPSLDLWTLTRSIPTNMASGRPYGNVFQTASNGLER